MPGAYRDDREAARAKIAELQAKLGEHRAKRLAITELKDAVDAIVNPPKTPLVSGPLLFGSFVVVVGACTVEWYWLVALGLIGVGVAIVLIARDSRGRIVEPPAERGEGETEEQKLIRQRIVEANVARIQLGEEQRREIDEEERICTALQEEIDQMKKLVGP